MSSPVSSERLPGPTARTSPCWGFSLAVSGMTRPLAVVSSASPGLHDDAVFERLQVHWRLRVASASGGG